MEAVLATSAVDTGEAISSAETPLDIASDKAARPRITPHVPQRFVFRIDPNALVSLLNFMISPLTFNIVFNIIRFRYNLKELSP